MSADQQDAKRYRLLRHWYLNGGTRADIDPRGHIRQTTEEIFDAGVDALALKFKVGAMVDEVMGSKEPPHDR